MTDDPWASALTDLVSWRERGDRTAARRALTFLEPQFRARVPARARRRLGTAVIDDGLQSFLEKLLRVRLDPTAAYPRAYLIRSFKNHFVDLEEAQARLPSAFLPDLPEQESPLPDPESLLRSAQDCERLRRALASLSTPDRVALKLADAPEWITDDEMAWLADETGRSVAQVEALIGSVDSPFDAMEAFEPSDREELEGSRRHRMERFRRRRARAREKLRTAFGEVDA